MELLKKGLAAENAELRQKLQEAQEEIRRLSSYQEVNPNPVLELDLDGNLVFVNPAARQTLANLGSNERFHDFLPADWQDIWKKAKDPGERLA